MKNKSVFLFALLTAFLWSCGGNSNEPDNNSSADQKSQETISNQYKSKKGVITADLPDGWNNKGKGPNTFSMYAYVADNSGDIYKDIKTFDYEEQLGEVEEVKVDDLPALTVKKKYMQNEKMLGQTWLVYNGVDIIEIVVQSQEANWDDNIANEIISLVKIHERTEGVVLLPNPKRKMNAKPDTYPEEFLSYFTDDFSSDSTLTISSVEKCTALFQFINDSIKEVNSENEEDKMKYLDSLAVVHGINNYESAIKIITVNNTAFKLFGTSMSFKEIDPNSEDFKISSEILTAIISQTGISENDMLFQYDNWEICDMLDKFLD
ncbi:MAG: hypothetical protein KAG64_08580 [Bacteroidales bacterium]|nr:hypothetical protein [Bacteroidales bacterium]